MALLWEPGLPHSWSPGSPLVPATELLPLRLPAGMRFALSIEEVCLRGNAWAFQNVSRVVRERRGDLGETENRRTI